MSENGVEYRVVPLDWIIPNPSNYNMHPPEQIASLKASLERFGQVRPYVVKQVDKQRFMLAAGEGTTIAARELVQTSPPQRFAHLSQAKIMVVGQNWSDEQLRGYMIADNETAKKAEPDEALLVQLLQQQQDAGYDLAALGSDEDALNDMLAKLTPPTLDELEEEYGDEPGHDAFWPVIRVKVSPETKELYDSLMDDAGGSDESSKFAWLLERITIADEVEA